MMNKWQFNELMSKVVANGYTPKCVSILSGELAYGADRYYIAVSVTKNEGANNITNATDGVSIKRGMGKPDSEKAKSDKALYAKWLKEYKIKCNLTT